MVAKARPEGRAYPDRQASARLDVELHIRTYLVLEPDSGSMKIGLLATSTTDFV
jgi:hypothetical protein